MKAPPYFGGGTLARCHIEMLLRPARTKGFDTDALLQRSGLLPMPLAGPLDSVTLFQFARTLRGLRRGLRDEMMALTSRPMRPGTFSLLVQQMLRCPTLDEALRLGCSLFRLVMDEFALRFRVEGHDAVLSVVDRTARHEHRTTAHLMLTYGAIGLVSWMVQRRIPLSAVRLPAPIPGCSLAPSLFDEPIRFGGPGEIRFDARWLNARISADIKALRSFLLYWPARQLPPHGEELPLAVRVRRSLRTWDLSNLPSLPSLAQTMGLTAKVLRRRLREEGYSYRGIVEALRCEEAMRLLDQPHLSVAEVGYRLGFSEPSAFHRAFKRGTGQTPTAYRHLLAQITVH